ncbi:hypothetical protein JCM11641_006755 [Rhodosporidiobolus odoratus]
MAQSDLLQLQSFLDSHNQPNQPLVVNDDVQTAGMSFAELFSHYLAPEVAKLAPSSEPIAPFTFGAPSDALPPPASTSTAFDPSTFMPTIPGSPIGGFSPSSDGNSLGHSPMSFPDLDFSSTSDPFSIDPALFGPPPSLSSNASTLSPVGSSVEQSPISLANAPLPPLPSLPSPPLAPPPAPLATEFLAPLPPAPEPFFASPAPLTATTAAGRPKRNVATMVIEEEEEEDVFSDGAMSDGSTATTTSTKTGSRKSTRAKKPAAKKTRTASGGASTGPKKLPKTSVLPLASETLHRTTAKSDLPPVPQWADKPDADEYAKLSSKEKRQLRNKLSARNFRHRRKEYITTLEEEISSRDTLIDTLRDEVGVMRAENSGLKTEVATLKEKWQDLLDKLSSLSTPPGAAPTIGAAGLGVNPSRAIASAGSPPVAVKQEEGWALDPPASSSQQLPPQTGGNAVASTSGSRRIGTRSSSSIQLPNLSKDLPPNALRRGTGSWATNGLGGGGFTSVHTTFVPDLGAQLAEGLNPKPAVPSLPFSSQSFNPALNSLAAAGQLDDLSSYTSHLRSTPSTTGPTPSTSGEAKQPKGTFEDFFASNPFWLRPEQLDQSRAALYGKLANNAAGLVVAQKVAKESQSQQQPPDGQDYLPVPVGFRPAFFRSSSSSGKKANDLLAFQSPSAAASLSSASSSSSIDPTLPMSHQEALTLRSQAALAAQVVNVAQKTLVQRMAGAFWEAFSGSPPAPSSATSTTRTMPPQLDSNKIAQVLSGKARVQVVPVDSGAGVDELNAAMGGLALSNRIGGNEGQGQGQGRGAVCV